MAAEYRGKGFMNAKVLDGGVKGWTAAGYEITKLPEP